MRNVSTSINNRSDAFRGQRGFTLIELIVVVSIIALLVAILLPAIGAFRNHATKAAISAHLNAIRGGIQQYYSDHKMYPVSDSGGHDSVPPAYGIIPPGYGAAMLAQGLQGYLPYSYDGAGPYDGTSLGNPDSNSHEPTLSFRTRRSAMGGQIYGAYVSPDSKGFKQFMLPSTTPLFTFIDPLGNDVLYYRSMRFDTNSGFPNPTKVFSATGTTLAPPEGYFNENDCYKSPTSNPNASTNPNQSSNPERGAFFKYLCDSETPNTITGPVLGAGSYLLISAGNDEKYFTRDDVVMSNQ